MYNRRNIKEVLTGEQIEFIESNYGDSYYKDIVKVANSIESGKVSVERIPVIEGRLQKLVELGSPRILQILEEVKLNMLRSRC